jgi:hypothetical protein
MSSIKRITIALYLSKVVALLIIFGRRVVQAMTGNPWFPTPVPPLATVTADLDALEAADAAVLARTKGAAAVRDLAQKKVVDDLGSLKGYAAGIVAQNPGQGAAIVESAGMFVKKPGGRNKANLAATKGPGVGDVIVRAKAVKRAAYEWQQSTDGGVTWVAVALTNVAHTTVTGLAVGSTHLFRFRTTVKNVVSDWSTPVSYLVH